MSTPAFFSNGKPIPGETFVPSSGSHWPSVVVAHGTAGMDKPFGVLIRDFSKQLSDSGFLAFIPQYFASTNTLPSLATASASKADVKRWVEVLWDATAHAQALAGDTSQRSGLVGFSLGAQLALSAAAGPTVKAVVDFFGPITSGNSPITPESVATLPPTLIHHGQKDQIVRPSESDQLARWLAAKSIDHRYDPHAYPSDGHPGQSLIPDITPADWSTASQTAATKETIAFLAKRLV